MQIQRIQNNNTSVGIKLVLRERMLPRKNWEEPNAAMLKKLVSTVETKTANKKGTMYIPGVWKDWEDFTYAENMNIYFNHGDYNDGVTLYDVHKLDLRNNPDKFIDTLISLTNVFKMRETAVKSTEKARRLITKLQSEVDKTFEKLNTKTDKRLKEIDHKVFANNVLDNRATLKPNGLDFNSLSDSFAEDEKIQKEILAKL